MSPKLHIAPAIRVKLANKQPPVTEEEIEQCFANRHGGLVIDTREANLTNPYTRWFIAETDFGRRLKIAFMPMADGIHIKTAYPPNENEERIYAERAL